MPKEDWPFIEKLMSVGYFSYLDYAFAEGILRNAKHASEKVGVFLCYLFLCARLGHSCIKVVGRRVEPNPFELLINDRDERTNELEIPLEQSIFDELSRAIADGWLELPDEVRVDMRFSEEPTAPLCVWKENIYLQKSWLQEKKLVQELITRLKIAPEILFEIDEVSNYIETSCLKNQLLFQQKQAILLAFNNSITLITGGPGTGKTYTAAQFISIFWKLLSLKQQANLEIVLAAPTGKAASRLYESFCKIFEKHTDSDLIDHISVKTLHSLLRIRKSGFREQIQSCLSADLVIVDESSMIDTQLMISLLQAQKRGSRLLFLGDKDQLPPVESGNFFADFIQADTTLEGESRTIIPIAKLEKCMRSELNEVIDFAASVNQGNCEKVLSTLNSSKGTIKRFSKNFELEDVQSDVIRLAASKYEIPGSNLPFADLLDFFLNFRILSPLRKGLLGVDHMNCLLEDYFKKQAFASQKQFIAPIMIRCNDYGNRLYNGDMGLLVQERPNQIPSAYFPSKEVERTLRRLPYFSLPLFDYAYCISVHQSQGSEFKEILVVLPDGSEYFGREVIYTAVTRAKESIHVYGKDQVIEGALKKQGRRLSGIKDRLDQLNYVGH